VAETTNSAVAVATVSFSDAKQQQQQQLQKIESGRHQTVEQDGTRL
jgi:hypothetical protein